MRSQAPKHSSTAAEKPLGALGKALRPNGECSKAQGAGWLTGYAQGRFSQAQWPLGPLAGGSVRSLALHRRVGTTAGLERNVAKVIFRV